MRRFAVRFQWQFNSRSDTGRLDNIRLLSGAVATLMPAIALSTERTVQVGQNRPGATLEGATALLPPIQRTPITDFIVATNGRNHFASRGDQQREILPAPTVLAHGVRALRAR